MAVNDRLINVGELDRNNEKMRSYVNKNVEGSVKGVKYEKNTFSFYAKADNSGDPLFTYNLPEEMFLDQTKTKLVDSFAWSEETYPGSTDPSLEGKSVLVLAVKGDESVNYSFVSLESIIKTYEGKKTKSTTSDVVDGNKISVDINISEETDNAVEIKDDGLYVPKYEIAEDSDIDDIWGKVDSTQSDNNA